MYNNNKKYNNNNNKQNYTLGNFGYTNEMHVNKKGLCP